MSVSTISAISLLICNAILVALIVLITVQFSKALRYVLSQLDLLHSREVKRGELLLDRFMARDFDHLQAYRLAESASTEPDEVSDEELRRERPWIQGPVEPQDTPEEILKDLEEVGG